LTNWTGPERRVYLITLKPPGDGFDDGQAAALEAAGKVSELVQLDASELQPLEVRVQR
jgi:hypothetical protein